MKLPNMSRSVLLSLFLSFTLAWPAVARDYRFDGSISRPVLESFLSRAITLNAYGHRPDMERALDASFIRNVGAKYIGRVAYIWGDPPDDIEAHFARAAQAACELKGIDSNIIVQACIFEAVGTKVTNVPVPAWVFEAFGLPVETRNFSYDAMVFTNDYGRDRWGPGCSVPDITRQETRLWFYYLARRYINGGYESLHFGQVYLTGYDDVDYSNWWNLLTMARAYGETNAPRHYVLCDAHAGCGIVSDDGHLMFDFAASPQRPVEVVEHPQEAVLEMGRSLYGRARGGIHPSGWTCEHSPFIVEFDNCEISDHPGEANTNDHWVWGYDEITWFALQPEQYRNDYLVYAWNWIREHDSNGWLQMPGSIPLEMEVNDSWWYYANTPSAYRPHGFNQEAIIAAIWDADKETNVITSHRYDFEHKDARDSADSLYGIPKSVSYTNASRIGNYAAVFDGEASRIVFPESDFGDTFSLAAWVFLEEPSDLCTVISAQRGGNANDGFCMYANNQWITNANGTFHFDTGNGTESGNSMVSGNVLPTGTWHHVAAVVNKTNGTVDLYVNGELLLDDGAIRSDFNSVSEWNIGSFIDDGNHCKGHLDDIRVTAQLLTAEEIRELAEVPEPCLCLFAVFPVAAVLLLRFQGKALLSL